MINFLFIFGAKYVFILSILIAGYYFLKQDVFLKKRIVIFSLVSLVFIGLFSIIASHAYYNPRPFIVGHFTPLIPHEANNGFPSDHVLLGSAIAAVITFFNRRVSVYLWIVVLLVGVSRVYVGVHHPVDVIASILISILGSFLAYLIVSRFPRVSSKPGAQELES